MNPRVYNKLYVNSNRDEGSEKILLGYQHDGKELVLKANATTYFHVPYFTDPVRLADSSLIRDGATPGFFPAASDRIFKNKKNYGNVTANGNPTDIADGVWFCSWLYKDENGFVQWVDRYYNPGSFKYSIATDQLNVPYTPYNPIFRDVPSQFIFEPGVMYKYFHIGEKEEQSLITTFGGLTGERLLLNLEGWGTDSADTSKNKILPIIQTNANNSELYTPYIDEDRVTKPTISYQHNKDLAISLNFKESFSPTEEFTWSGSFKSPNWKECQTTQLIGNYTSQGGVGVFIESLSSFPFFVIPETYYGHVLFINEGINGFLDKSVQSAFGVSVNPQLICIDSNQHVIICHKDNSGFIYKLDNLGNLIASSKLTTPSFGFLYADETPLQLLCGSDDRIIIRTNRNIYTFDTALNLISNLVYSSSLSSVAAFRYNETNNFSELDITSDVYDSKFIGTTQWYLSRIDGNLYKKIGANAADMFYDFAEPATNIAIDPYNRLWILHGKNRLTVLDSEAEPFSGALLETTIGIPEVHISKNISFICQYDRTTQQREWKAVLYYSNERTLYCLNMDAKLDRSLNMFSLFNSTNLNILNQNSELFEFLGQGDFTGYEHKRVFKNLLPYKNSSQLVLKASLRDKTKSDLFFGFFKKQISIDNWDLNSWQHIALTLKNKTFVVYVNGIEKIKWSYPGNYELSYELQPSFSIGVSNGSSSILNQEVQYVTSIFNGLIEDIKVYDYAIDPKNIELFVRSVVPASNIYWSLPVPDIQYIEKIERMFKNKIPGAKAPFYKVKIKGTEIKDSETRILIEEQIKQIARQLQPAYADLLEVHWVD